MAKGTTSGHDRPRWKRFMLALGYFLIDFFKHDPFLFVFDFLFGLVVLVVAIWSGQPFIYWPTVMSALTLAVAVWLAILDSKEA